MKTNPGKSAKGVKGEPKGEGQSKVRRTKQGKGPRPFNNPFADALKK